MTTTNVSAAATAMPAAYLIDTFRPEFASSAAAVAALRALEAEMAARERASDDDLPDELSDRYVAAFGAAEAFLASAPLATTADAAAVAELAARTARSGFEPRDRDAAVLDRLVEYLKGQAAPASPDEPLRRAIRDYRAGLAASRAAPDDEPDDEVAARTWRPAWEALKAGRPATSAEGAVAALELLRDEIEGDQGEALVPGLVASAVGFLQRHVAPAPVIPEKWAHEDFDVRALGSTTEALAVLAALKSEASLIVATLSDDEYEGPLDANTGAQMAVENWLADHPIDTRQSTAGALRHIAAKIADSDDVLETRDFDLLSRICEFMRSAEVPELGAGALVGLICAHLAALRAFDAAANEPRMVGDAQRIADIYAEMHLQAARQAAGALVATGECSTWPAAFAALVAVTSTGGMVPDDETGHLFSAVADVVDLRALTRA